jgi:hypothetical protein
MITGPGGRYRIELELLRATQLGPSWLVGAFAVSYPRADVTAVQSYSGTRAVVLVRWRGASGQISKGDRVSILTEGLQLPGQMAPTGVVTAVEQTASPPLSTSLERGIRSSLKLTMSGALLLTVAYFSRKIGDRHGNTHTA